MKPGRTPSSNTPPSAPETIEGVLERVLFHNEENGWSAVRLTLDDMSEVAAVGTLIAVRTGERLRLTGNWTLDPRFGRQFRVESYVVVRPSTLAGIRSYLGSGMVPGVGKVIAERLVAQFGLETLEIIDHHPERLAEVPGIGPMRAERLVKAWAEQRQVRDVMIFLQSYGISSAFAARIFRQYRDRAVAIVTENPYRLAIDIHGIGFKTADRIAAQLGIPPTSPRRAEAGVLHVLGLRASEGHVFCPRDALVRDTAQLLEVEAALIEQAIADLAGQGPVVIEAQGGGQPDAVYTKLLQIAEAGSAALLGRLLQSRAAPLAIDAERALAWFEERSQLKLAPEQQDAIRGALTSRLLVVTGGPGTGKTTLVNGIIQILERKGLRILLAAPTGRAAKRLAETTGHEAKTIHRLLEFNPQRMSFEREAANPLEADLVILDEASMLDIVLAHHVLKALPPGCRLVLVGDVDQLPSVGPGSVLRDVIASGTATVIRLQHIFRQAQRSLIVENAHRVNAGQLPETAPRDADADFFFIERRSPEEIAATLESLITDRIPGKFGLDPVDDIQVLTPMHRGELGVTALNTRLQALLNREVTALVRADRTYRLGDKVMQTRNNYELDVFNGDIGRIVRLDADDAELTIDYDGRRVTYESSDLDDVVLSYACSIHKSQGSEYPCVVLPLHTQHFTLLQRNLLYTAITRGRRLVVVVGSRRALEIAVRNDRIDARNTRLAERLRLNS